MPAKAGHTDGYKKPQKHESMFCGKKSFSVRKAPELSESGKETGSDKRQAALIDNKMPVFQHPVV